MFGKIVGTLVGAGLAFLSGWAIWKLFELIFTGVSKANWLQVIAGGILAYLFVGLFAIVFILGLFLLVLTWAD